MGRVHLLCIVLGMSGTSILRAADAPPVDVGQEVSAPLYLSYFGVSRELGFDAIKAEGDVREATAMKDRDVRIHAMNEALWRRGTLSETDYRRSILRRDVSIARAVAAPARLLALKSSSAINQVQARFATGAKVNFEDFYALYVEQWHHQCEAYKAIAGEYEAKVRLAEFELTTAQHLYDRQAISLEELINKQTAHTLAVSQLQVQKDEDAVCLQNLPTYEFLRDVQNGVFRNH